MTLPRFREAMQPLIDALDPDDLIRRAFEAMDCRKQGFLTFADFSQAICAVRLLVCSVLVLVCGTLLMSHSALYRRRRRLPRRPI